MKNIPSVDNGKPYGTPINISMLPLLPTDAPHANYLPKMIDIILRSETLNLLVQESYSYWEMELKNQEPKIYPGKKHEFANEHIIFQMTKISDELIALIWSLGKFKKTSIWPSKIEIDDIGAFLNAKSEDKKILSIFKHHKAFLKKLNEIGNAFKHSFANSGLMIMGADEPCIKFLSYPKNDASTEYTAENIGLEYLVSEFSKVYSDAMQWLKEYSV